MSAVHRHESHLAEVQSAIRAHQWDAVRGMAGSLHPADIADLIVDLPDRDEGVFFRLLPRELATRAFAYLPLDHQRVLISSLSSDEVGEIVRGIAPDDRNRLFDGCVGIRTEQTSRSHPGGRPPNRRSKSA